MYKKAFVIATLLMFANMVSADYTGTYQFDDIENATGDLTLRILVGITQRGTLIGSMQGLVIAIGSIIAVIALIILLLRKFGTGAKGKKGMF